MRLSTILFFLFNMIICNYLITPYTSPCRNALKKYKWVQDQVDDQYAYFLDDEINSKCHINYSKQRDEFYVIDDTKTKRMNQFFIKIIISTSITIFFMAVT